MIHVIEHKDFFELGFAFHPKILEDVKAIPGRRFDHNKKAWFAPISEAESVKKLILKYGAPVEDPEPEQISGPFVMPELTVEIPLKRQLFPYQKTGVAYALEKKRLIIGDQPGLGKTGQAIATITAAGAFPCLVICPSSIKINWQREWEIWTDKRAVIMADNVRNTWPHYLEARVCDVMIVNYESLKKYFVKDIVVPKGAKMSLKNVQFHPAIKMFKSVIIDESHRCKDTKTQQSKFVKGLAHGKEWILALTGTPVVNRPKDLISQLGIIDRLKDLGGFIYFLNRYCGGSGKGAFNIKELNGRLTANCFYRRDKSDVLKDLPAKMRQVVLCEIDNRKEYSDAVKDLEAYLKEYRKATDTQVKQSMKGEVMVKLGVLKNISARGKLNDVFDFISDIIEQGEKIVVFLHLKEVAEAVLGRFPQALTIRGGDDMKARQTSVDRFQNDPNCQIIVCSIKAAGVGLTLTASSRLAFIEQGWHAADMEQCEDRCHRIGQRDSVQCIYFLGKNTIDEKIYKLIDSKREVANTITGAVDNVQVSIIDDVIDLFSQDFVN